MTAFGTDGHGAGMLTVGGVSVTNPVVLTPGTSADVPGPLSLDAFIAVTRGDDQGRVATVALSEESAARIGCSHDVVCQAVRKAEQSGNPAGNDHLDHIYGVNTGFGCNRNVPIDSFEKACRLSEYILYSHATGVGRPLPSDVVRGMMLLRLRTFAEGRSGLRLEVVRFLIEMLNRRVHPVVPEKGSVGASGDLCPSAHLFLPLVGAGAFWVEPDYPQGIGRDNDGDRRGEPLSGDDALERESGLEPLAAPADVANLGDDAPRLAPKEGLAVTNGTALSTALLALAVYDADLLWNSANQVGAMTLQALGGPTRAYDPKVQQVRPHPGQIATAEAIMRHLQGENGALTILVNRAPSRGHMQDDYSIRAMPSVHGAAYDAIAQARRVVEIELNAVTDNPLLFAEPDDSPAVDQDASYDWTVSRWPTYAAANFHAEPIALAADYLKIAVSELASIAERRIQLLLDADHNRGLPANLTGGEPGLNSGFMVFQYTAASLVSENKTLAHPSSVDSIPTSSNAEDHVSMAANAARHLRTVVGNTRTVLAIEMLCARQALLLRLLGRTTGTKAPDSWRGLFDLTAMTWDDRFAGIGASAHDTIRRLGYALAGLARDKTDSVPPYQVIAGDVDFRLCPPGEMIAAAVGLLIATD